MTCEKVSYSVYSRPTKQGAPEKIIKLVYMIQTTKREKQIQFDIVCPKTFCFPPKLKILYIYIYLFLHGSNLYNNRTIEIA